MLDSLHYGAMILMNQDLQEVMMLTLYKPKYEDLWFRQMMLADEDTMSYNHA